jgi:hypothetical protein
VANIPKWFDRKIRPTSLGFSLHVPQRKDDVLRTAFVYISLQTHKAAPISNMLTDAALFIPHDSKGKA